MLWKLLRKGVMTSRLEIKNSLRPKVKKSLAFEYNETMIKLIPVIVV